MSEAMAGMFTLIVLVLFAGWLTIIVQIGNIKREVEMMVVQVDALHKEIINEEGGEI